MGVISNMPGVGTVNNDAYPSQMQAWRDYFTNITIAELNAIVETIDEGLKYAQVATPTGMVEGDKWLKIDTDEVYWYESSAWVFKYVRHTTATGMKNKLINGLLNINQKEVSGTVVLASGEYGHDRMKGGASGCTYTFATSANVTTVTISAGSLIQVVEGESLLTGTHTLSWTGTCQGKIGGGSYSSSGVTGSITGGADTNIEFNTGTLTKFQLEIGSIITDFEMRLKGLELSLCLSFSEMLDNNGSGASFGMGFANTTAQCQIHINMQPKRGTTHDITIPNPTDFTLSDGATGTAVTTITKLASLSTKTTMVLVVDVSGTPLTAQRAYRLQGGNISSIFIEDEI